VGKSSITFPIGSTQETFALLATGIDKVDVTLPGWLPCHAADARVPGWHIVDQMQTLLVACTLRKKDP
jgi:hypothetical protein